MEKSRFFREENGERLHSGTAGSGIRQRIPGGLREKISAGRKFTSAEILPVQAEPSAFAQGKKGSVLFLKSIASKRPETARPVRKINAESLCGLTVRVVEKGMPGSSAFYGVSDGYFFCHSASGSLPALIQSGIPARSSPTYGSPSPSFASSVL